MIRWVERRRRRARLLVIGALAGGEQLSGWQLMRKTGLSAPRLYGAIDDLEASGWISGGWSEGSDRRRTYEIVLPLYRREVK